MATGSKAATNWKAQSASYLPRTLKRLILQQIDFVLRSKDLVMYSELRYFLITMGAKIVKFMTDFKKPRHSYMKQPLVMTNRLSYLFYVITLAPLFFTMASHQFKTLAYAIGLLEKYTMCLDLIALYRICQHFWSPYPKQFQNFVAQ